MIVNKMALQSCGQQVQEIYWPMQTSTTKPTWQQIQPQISEWYSYNHSGVTDTNHQQFLVL
jgi:hypothetical protein